MSGHRWTGMILGVAVLLMVPSAAATNSDRTDMERPGPWLELMLSEEAASADPEIAALHIRARLALIRLQELDTDR
jgi:hypothetical protein